MKLLTAAEILGKDDTQYEVVECPEWGGSVRVRSLSGDEREAFEKSCTRVVGRGKNQTREMVVDALRVKLVAASLCDENGAALFSAKDVEALKKKNSAVIERLYDVAARLSGLSEEDVDELAGESEADPDSSSSTD